MGSGARLKNLGVYPTEGLEGGRVGSPDICRAVVCRPKWTCLCIPRGGLGPVGDSRKAFVMVTSSCNLCKTEPHWKV